MSYHAAGGPGEEDSRPGAVLQQSGRSVSLHRRVLQDGGTRMVQNRPTETRQVHDGKWLPMVPFIHRFLIFLDSSCAVSAITLLSPAGS